MHSWNTFGVRTSQKQIRTHKTHHSLNLGEANTLYSMVGHRTSIQMTFCPETPKWESWLLVVKSQIGDLTPDPSFGHNLCFRCPNGSCEPISDIYIRRASQWFNNSSIHWVLIPAITLWRFGIPIPKVGTPLGVWGFIPSHSLTFPRTWDVTPGLHLGPPPCKPLPWSRAQG
jgi:hypothetical protein